MPPRYPEGGLEVVTKSARVENQRALWGMSGYQWMVLFAAWLGWGFDAFDALLFNYVAPQCIPALLGIPLDSPEARPAALYWTGALTSLLLVGWALGGVAFGRLADAIGRSRTLMLTILLYSLGTAACAFAPNLVWLALFRFISSLGIGGEWAAGAAMVAEVVPERRRLEAGALLYSAAPVGIFMAGFVSSLVVEDLMPGDPAVSWRYVFLAGLVPAFLAIGLRWFIHEPEVWRQASGSRMAELFSPEMRRRTFSGLTMALAALLTWWSCNAFLPLVAGSLAQGWAAGQGLAGAELAEAISSWKSWTINLFNFGGLLGTFLTVPLARSLGRRATFGIYFAVSGFTLLTTFGADLSAPVRLGMFFLIGLTGYGVLGSFTYYLPELFPTRLRATGSGFCYNIGRVLTAAGPFFVASVASGGGAVLEVMFLVGFIPLAALLFLPWVVETRGQPLS